MWKVARASENLVRLQELTRWWSGRDINILCGPSAKATSSTLMVAASEVSVFTEKRRSPRFPFHAEAKISEKESGGELVTRVSELSVNGCYIDEQNPFPSGTIITLKIISGSEVFDATAKVLYAHANLGMGVEFQDVSLRSGTVLREWLLAAKASEEKQHS